MEVVAVLAVDWGLLCAPLDPQPAVTRSKAKTIADTPDVEANPVSHRLLPAALATPPSPIVNMQNAKTAQLENGGVDKPCTAMTEGTSTVNVVAKAPPDGFTFCGLKLQAAPAGRPAHAKVRVWLNPFSGETLIIRVPDPPGATVRDELLSERE